MKNRGDNLLRKYIVMFYFVSLSIWRVKRESKISDISPSTNFPFYFFKD